MHSVSYGFSANIKLFTYASWLRAQNSWPKLANALKLTMILYVQSELLLVNNITSEQHYLSFFIKQIFLNNITGKNRRGASVSWRKNEIDWHRHINRKRQTETVKKGIIVQTKRLNDIQWLSKRYKENKGRNTKYHKSLLTRCSRPTLSMLPVHPLHTWKKEKKYMKYTTNTTVHTQNSKWYRYMLCSVSLSYFFKDSEW